ncbi:anthocyanidin 3-O-glucosyltransferase 2-like [Benincasa hispida]|uniref:anthocyanidin 3-O-glucosyltransferase 2-like n=1 Tax=Benincasa hispida TaxID=102211 RepID=UPI0019028175|nr:anthocyanidin 3-O-glucosyltransferase 2-like [Benincasa hispida]
MKKFELIFIPGPGIGHLASTVEMANILVTRDPRLAVTVLIMQSSYDKKSRDHIQLLSESFVGKSIHFILLPELPLPEECKNGMPKPLIDIYKPHVREAMAKHANSQTNPDLPQLVGFVIDMFCMTIIDVAKEFKVPCYVFYTSSAAFLAFNFHLQMLYDQSNSNQVVEQLKNSDSESLTIPSFVNPIPGKVIPSVFVYNDVAVWLYESTRRFRTEIRGVLINTCAEIESHVINMMSSGSSSQLPSLYCVGPILNMKNTVDQVNVLKWLDDQPQASVVFLCFGSMGSFDEDQVKEIARGLERSGVRFLWSLRQPPPKGKWVPPSDYADVKDVLPEGFLDRTASVGKIIGWAPQIEILSHPNIGGFISHCGWNSTLESLWHGVPMVAWPMYAEQQLNAFQMVVELGLAVDITLDYRKDYLLGRSKLVTAEEIESGIRKLMDEGDEIRKKVKAKSEEIRKAVMDGGSSYTALTHFINDVLANSSKGKD